MNPLLTDQSIIPDKALVTSLIGDKAVFHEKLLKNLHLHFKGSTAEWKYYKDAKRWLMPVVYKKKNLCWIHLADNMAKVSIWFGKRFETIVEKSDLPQSVKERYRSAEITKMGRGIGINLETDADIEDVIKVLDFKSKVK